ncbi:elongation factor P [candidate division WOR-3 bacterium]|nr:elongation factor P [candidate division WOR-3 bacterium]
MIQATQIRKGMVVKLDEIPHIVLGITHITPGNKRGMIICSLRNLKTGLSKEKRFRSGDRIEEADIEEIEMEYLYSTDGEFNFMNSESYEQIALGQEIIADAVKFLKPNIHVKVEFYEGKPFGIVLPKYVSLKVTETQAYMKDATAQARSKPARLEGGHICQVPPFVAVGDIVKIKTDTGEYVERV